MIAQGPPGGDERDLYGQRVPGDVSPTPYGYPRPSDPNNPFGADPFASDPLYGDELSPFGGQHPLADPQNDPDEGLEFQADPRDFEDPPGYSGNGNGTPPTSGTSILALLSGAGLGVLVLGGMAWFLLGGTGEDLSLGETLLEQVNGEPGPFRERPEEPGGLQVENQNRAVYGRIGETDTSRSDARPEFPEPPGFPPPPPVMTAAAPAGIPSITEPLDPSDEPVADAGFPEPPPLPEADPFLAESAAPPAPASRGTAAQPSPAIDLPPEIPIPVPAPAPVPEANAYGGIPIPDPRLPAVPAPDSPAERPAAPATPPSARPLIQDVPPATGPAPSVSGAPRSTPSERSATGPVPLVPPPPAAAPAQTTAPAAPATATPAAPSRGDIRGTAAIQLVSVRSQDAARAEWKRIQTRNKDLLGSAAHEIVRVELPERGTYFRVRVIGLRDEAAARALCDALAKRSQGCIVAR